MRLSLCFPSLSQHRVLRLYSGAVALFYGNKFGRCVVIFDYLLSFAPVFEFLS